MNLPNRLTVLRLILIPVFAALFFIPIPVKDVLINYVLALAVFGIAAFTDFLDGYFARKYNLITTLGKFLDPIADKLLVSTALILLLTVPQVMPVIAGAVCVSIILARELLISAFRQIAAAQNVIMAADMAGKVKTVFQDVAIIVLLFTCQFTAFTGEVFFTVLYWTGFGVLVVATALSVISAVNYIVKNKSVLKG